MYFLTNGPYHYIEDCLMGGTDMEIDYRDPNIVYFSANGAMPSNTSGGSIYKVIALGLLVDVSTGDILDADINMVTPLSVRFIREQLIGMNLRDDWDAILARFERLQAPAQKAVTTALKAVAERYQKFSKKI